MDIMKKLRDELAELDRELKLVLPKMIREAASHGDLSENAEYEAAKQRQVWVNARMGHIRQRLQALSLINFNDIPTDRVGFGSRVTVEDVDTGERKTFRLVHPEEVDAERRDSSRWSRPIGHALAGKEAGGEPHHPPPGRRQGVRGGQVDHHPRHRRLTTDSPLPWSGVPFSRAAPCRLGRLPGQEAGGGPLRRNGHRGGLLVPVVDRLDGVRSRLEAHQQPWPVVGVDLEYALPGRVADRHRHLRQQLARCRWRRPPSAGNRPA